MSSARSSDIFPGLGPYCTDPAQHLITAGQDQDDLDRDLSYPCDKIDYQDRHLSGICEERGRLSRS